MKKVILSILALSLTVVSFAQTNGGNRTTQETATLNMNEVMDLSMTSTGLNFVFNNTSDYDNGIVKTEATSFSVKSNQLWQVKCKASAANFTGGDGSMPVSVLSLGKRTTGTTIYTALSNTDNVLATGNRGASAVSGNTFAVDYKANPGYAYAPASYTVDVIYTISAQ